MQPPESEYAKSYLFPQFPSEVFAMGSDRAVEVPPTGMLTNADGKKVLVDMTDPKVVRTAGTQVADGDPYAYSGAPEDGKTGDRRIKDPYGYSGSPEDQPIKLSPEVEAKIKEQAAAYQKKLEDNNFHFGFNKTEGPWNAIERLRNDALAKQKAGKELTKEEKAVLSVGADWVADSIRIRDRDFAKFKEQNDPRNYYKTSDRTVRYTDKEIAEMTAQEEGKLRAAAEKQAKAEAEQARQAELEKQRQAAELETQRQAELEKQRQAAELETQRQAELERQRALAAAIERNVPSDAIVGKALVQSELGKDTDAPAVRNAMKAFVTQEIAAGTLKPENLNAPYPRVGAAFVGTGAVTAQEFQAAIDQQNKLREADPNKQAPQIGAILLETFKNDPAKVAKIKKASNFYDVMKKLAEEEAAAQAAKK